MFCIFRNYILDFWDNRVKMRAKLVHAPASALNGLNIALKIAC